MFSLVCFFFKDDWWQARTSIKWKEACPEEAFFCGLDVVRRSDVKNNGFKLNPNLTRVCALCVVPVCCIFYGLSVGFRWASGGQSKTEWVSLSNRMVLLWVCPSPSFRVVGDLVDGFYVVYKAICAPPPILLESLLN